MFTKKTKISILKAIITKRVPIYVQFAVTKNCNLRCKMCASNSSRSQEKDLSVNDIGKIAAVLDKIGVAVVVLTGGEPFIRNDLPEIISAFTKRGITVRVQTNGILATEDKIKLSINAGLKDITISLDTLSGELQDRISGKSGSWNEIINSIVRFSALLPKRGTILGLNTVVSKYNIDEIHKMVKFATKIGFYISLIPVHISSSNKNFLIRKDAQDYAFKPEDFSKINEVYDRIISMKKAGYNVYNSYRFLKESPDFLKYGKIHWKCDSPDLYFAISPSGNFLPCVDINTEISMLDDDFLKNFKSGNLRQYIKSLVAGCPGCFYACWPEMSYLCRDFKVLIERLLLGFKTSINSRKILEYKSVVNIVNQIKNEDNTN